MLSFFDHLFVQDKLSQKMLASIGYQKQVTIAGDSRFDRVIQIAESFSPIPAIEKFVGLGKKIIVAGSTWPADEEILQKALATINDPSLLLIIAPHEINKEHVSQLKQLFPASFLFSQATADTSNQSSHVARNVMIIDNIGMLSRLYKYATISYIGGGFGKGIHNTLESAVYGNPVIFGPHYKKFNEAVELIQCGSAVSINNSADCVAIIEAYLHDEKKYNESCEKAQWYVYNNRGATEKILAYVQEKRLLTN